MSPKRYAVTPRHRGKQYHATFRNNDDERVSRSLGTSDEAEANAICNDLVQLYNGSTRYEDHHPKAFSLFFGRPLAVPMHPGKGRGDDTIRALTHEIQELRAENATLREELRALQQSQMGRLLEAERRVPTLPDAFDEFASLRTQSGSERHNRQLIHTTKAFVESFDPTKKPTDIEPSDVNQWLTDRVANYLARRDLDERSPKTATYRNNQRKLVATFVNWCAKTYGIESVMKSVPRPAAGTLRRERGEITWHSVDEVEAVLAKLDTYWAAVVATIAYAGLRRAELCYLRRQDLIESGDDGRLKLVVTSYSEHSVKTGKTRRVDVDSELLAPRLRALLKIHDGSDALFFYPPSERQTKNPDGTKTARLMPDRLTKTLCGQVRTGEKSQPGIVPKGMTAQRLRRTCGSILIRRGYSAEAIAAVLGNTADVVREHYASIMADEVEVRLRD